MKKQPTCKHPGCTEPVVSDANFCSPHLAEPRRCRAVRATTGEQCKRPAMKGLTVCSRHGGGSEASRAKSQRAKALTVMQRFVLPYEGDVDPISVFEEEFRRTLGRIRWYDEQLSLLRSAEDLIWGRTKVERIQASEFGGTNTTYEAKVHLLEELQFKERRHLLDMEKVWISAGLETQKLNLMKRYVDATYAKMLKALVMLGIDTADPKTRQILANVFLGEEGDGVVAALSPAAH